MLRPSLNGFNITNKTSINGQIILRPIGIVTNNSSSLKPQFVAFKPPVIPANRPVYPVVNSTNPRSLLPPPTTFSQSLIRPVGGPTIVSNGVIKSSPTPQTLLPTHGARLPSNCVQHNIVDSAGKPIINATSMATPAKPTSMLAKVLAMPPTMPPYNTPNKPPYNTPNKPPTMPAYNTTPNKLHATTTILPPYNIPTMPLATTTTPPGYKTPLRPSSKRNNTPFATTNNIDNDTDYKPFTAATMRKHARARSRSSATPPSAPTTPSTTTTTTTSSSSSTPSSTTPVASNNPNDRKPSARRRNTRPPARYSNAEDNALFTALAASAKLCTDTKTPPPTAPPPPPPQQRIEPHSRQHHRDHVPITQPRRATLFTKGPLHLKATSPSLGVVVGGGGGGGGGGGTSVEVGGGGGSFGGGSIEGRGCASNVVGGGDGIHVFKKPTAPRSRKPKVKVEPQSLLAPPPPQAPRQRPQGPCVEYTPNGYTILSSTLDEPKNQPDPTRPQTSSANDFQTFDDLDFTSGQLDARRTFNGEPYVCVICNKKNLNSHSGELYGPLLHNTSLLPLHFVYPPLQCI